MSKLLINESPLQVLPSLAVAVGLNEAIVLQQIHYWLERSQHDHDGRHWVYNTVEGWHAQFRFWSIPTVKRTLTSLREQGLIIVTDRYNKMPLDKTLWYAIDYEALEALEAGSQGEDEPPAPASKPEVEPMILRLDQNDPIERINMISPLDQIDPTNNQRLTTVDYTETNAEKAEAAPMAPLAASAAAPQVAPSGGHVSFDAIKEQPAIKAYYELYGLYPTRAQCAAILAKAPPMREWLRAIHAWQLAGHNPTNLDGILDWALDPKRIPGPSQMARRAPKGNRPEDYTDLPRSYDPATFIERAPRKKYSLESYRL